MEPLTALIEALKNAGVPGLVFGLLVLVAVYIAKYSGIVISGNTARLANLVLSALLAGLGTNGGSSNETLVAGIAALSSALVHELLERITQKKLVKKI